MREQKEFKNKNSEDKVWIDLVDPPDEVVKSIATQFHIDSSALELLKNKSKKPQIRILETTPLLYC